MQVSWSHTYTRPGYQKRKHHSVPRDWWTEDISDLDLDLFRCIITAARSSFTLPPQLIGEALHVYTCRWLPYFKSKSHSGFSVKENEAALERHRRVVNTVVNMIPADKGSVSEGFLLRLVSIATYVGASLTTKTELIRKAGLQLEEATLADLLLPSQSSSHHHRYDTDLVAAVLDSFLMLWRRQTSAHVSSNSQLLHSIRKVAKLIDSYLQAVSQDVHMPVPNFVSLAEAVPDIARESHDRLYKAINMYLKVLIPASLSNHHQFWYLEQTLVTLIAGASGDKQRREKATMQKPRLPEVVCRGTRPRCEKREDAIENCRPSPLLRPREQFQGSIKSSSEPSSRLKR